MKRSRIEKIIAQFRVKPGQKVCLKDYDPAWMGTEEMRELGKQEMRARTSAFLQQKLAELAEQQELLWASGTYAVLVVLQAMDAAGKDGTIKHVMSGVNPQGCQVYSFKAPSSVELNHTWLWRYMKSLPERGRICIFNRSHYEDVLVVKVHKQLLAKQKLPPECLKDDRFWKDRYEDIKAFERHLTGNGTVIVKVFLHLSKKEQKQRLLERLETPSKQWKFSEADLAERAFWDDYQQAFEDALSATSTGDAPWYVIPADRKWVARALVAQILTASIRRLNLSYPEVGDEKLRGIAEAKRQLESED